MKKTLLLSLLVSLAFALNATTYVFNNNGGDNLWNNSANWDINGVPPAPLMTGDVISINANCDLNVAFDLTAGATMNVNGVRLRVLDPIAFDVRGDLNITNTGKLTIQNGGTVTIRVTGTLNNSGTINNNGNLINRNSFTNSGTINNNNNGTITNGGRGTIDNGSNGTINNLGSITNNGAITIEPGNFTGNSPTGMGNLPIELLSFDPYKVGNTVVVKWITASEKENAYMEVQRSRDGIHFISIHHEKGHGTTSQQQTYEWTDEAPMQGVNYYRLKQVDFDSNATVHEIRSVDFDGKTSNSSLHLYPTEVQNQLTVVLDAPVQDDQSALLIVDMLGRIVQQHKLSRDAVQQDVQVGNLPSGQYFITLQSGKTLQTARFVKL